MYTHMYISTCIHTYMYIYVHYVYILCNHGDTRTHTHTYTHTVGIPCLMIAVMRKEGIKDIVKKRLCLAQFGVLCVCVLGNITICSIVMSVSLGMLRVVY